MAKAVTQQFKDLVLEVSFTKPGDALDYKRICGIMGVTITRSTNVETTEVPDCGDESLPNEIQRDIRSLEVSVSGSGVWAQSSHGKMMDWWYGGKPLPVRVGNLNAKSGDTEYESGTALLTELSNERPDGKGRVSASITIEFLGTPERLAKA